MAPEGMSMSTPDRAAELQVIAETQQAPGQMSRRSVLRGAAGAGVAGLAAAALVGTPALAASRALEPAAPKLDQAEGPTAREPVVVHVLDLHTGQMDVYRGTSHIRIHDRQLAAQLARVSQ
jgi:transketolase C-terminal domain/subunit